MVNGDVLSTQGVAQLVGPVLDPTGCERTLLVRTGDQVVDLLQALGTRVNRATDHATTLGCEGPQHGDQVIELKHWVAAGDTDRGTGLADLEPLGRTTDHDVAGLGIGEDEPHLLQSGQVPDVGRQGLAGVQATGDLLLETSQRDQPQSAAAGEVGVVGGRGSELAELFEPAGGVDSDHAGQQAAGVDVDPGHFAGVGDRSAGTVDIFPGTGSFILDQFGQRFEVGLGTTGDRRLGFGGDRGLVDLPGHRLPGWTSGEGGLPGRIGHGPGLDHRRDRGLRLPGRGGASHHGQGTDDHEEPGDRYPHRGATVGSTMVEIGLSWIAG